MGALFFNQIITIPISLDIKPQSCPNPLNAKSKGVLPVAILGSDELDVSNIDPQSVSLAGVSPVRWSIEDVSTPVLNSQNACDCTNEGADGFDDLTLKFKTQDIVAVIGSVNNGDEIVLAVTGELFDGTLIEGEDCIIIKSKGFKNQKTISPGPLENFSVLQNYPNRFNPETEIHFQLPAASQVLVRIFNTLGQEIRILTDREYEAGFHSLRWDSKDNNGNLVSSGIYLYQLKAGTFSLIKKMSLIR